MPKTGLACAALLVAALSPAPLARAQSGSQQAPREEALRQGASQTPCSKPALVERMSVPKEDLAALFERGQSYSDCMSKAIEAKRANANRLMDEAKAEAEASNAMVKEVNDFVAALRAYEAEHRDDQ